VAAASDRGACQADIRKKAEIARRLKHRGPEFVRSQRSRKRFGPGQEAATPRQGICDRTDGFSNRPPHQPTLSWHHPTLPAAAPAVPYKQGAGPIAATRPSANAGGPSLRQGRPAPLRVRKVHNRAEQDTDRVQAPQPGKTHPDTSVQIDISCAPADGSRPRRSSPSRPRRKCAIGPRPSPCAPARTGASCGADAQAELAGDAAERHRQKGRSDTGQMPRPQQQSRADRPT